MGQVSSDKIYLKNKIGSVISPATEEKQDDLIDNQTNGTQKTQIIDGLNIGSYDYFSLAQDTLTDTYTFKVGGASGTTVATVLITYTSADKSTISSVLKS